MGAGGQETWTSYVAWLSTNAAEAFANLAPGATDEEIRALTDAIEPTPPADLVALLRLNNGQRNPNGCCVLPGLEFLSTTRIIQEWQKWRDFRESETPEGIESLDNYSDALDAGVFDKYSHAGWIPAFKDGWRTDYVGFDMSPAEGGTVGQIINFGRDEDQHFIAFPSLSGLLTFWLALVREGQCQVKPADPPEQPSAWFEHELNGIDVLRRAADERRGETK